MKVVTFLDIMNMKIQPTQCCDWVSDMIRHKKDAVLPTKIHMTMEGNIFCNVMPCIIPVSGHLWGGVKIVTRYPERVPALDSKLLLFDAESGEFLALMDADWITAMRTGAVAAHSAVQFARSDFQTLGMIGLGNTARATMLCLAETVTRDLHVKLLRYKDQAERFMERFAEYPRLHFSIEEDPTSVVKGADVVVSCATYFDRDICPDDCFDEGVLVVPVHTRGFTNCDLFFDKVFADDTGHVSDFRYFSEFRSFAEVCDVVNGLVPGRENDRERILAYNIGLAVHDVFFAARIYQLAWDNKELFSELQDIKLCEPTEKFWV
jgi:ornithine cyclodeaminase/alanine dehydrogenase